MGKIKIQTAQNITIEQNLAGVGQRFLAVLIDALFLGLFYYFIFYLLSLTKFEKNLSAWSFMTVLMLPYLLYYPLLQYWNNGQTLGKQLVHIRIIKQDNSHPRLGDFLIRWILRLFEVNMIPGLGLIVILFSDKNQRLGDIAAKTVVISEKKKTALNHSIFEEIEKVYQPVYPQASMLKEKDVQLIKSVFIEAKNHNNRQLLKELTIKLEKLLSVKRPKDMSYRQFIDTIIKDYNYFASL